MYCHHCDNWHEGKTCQEFRGVEAELRKNKEKDEDRRRGDTDLLLSMTLMAACM
jgi:hypothetical protein